MSWDGWFRANGVERETRQQRVLLNNHPLVIQQAVAGEGIALGWRYLVDELVSNNLLMFVGQPAETGNGFYMTWPARGPSDRCERVASALIDAVEERATLKV